MSWTRAAGAIMPALLCLAGFSYAPAATPLTLTLGASSVVGGNGTTATITLGVAADTGGAIVTVTNPPGTTVRAGANRVGNIQTQGSTRLAVRPGQRQVTFDVQTSGVATTTAVTFTATFGGEVATAALTITPAKPRAVIVSPASVTGGQSVSATIVLDGAAPIGVGVSVSLTTGQPTAPSADGSVRPVGASTSTLATALPPVFFPPGTSSMSVTVATTAVTQNQTIAVTATIDAASASTTLLIKPPVVTQLQLAPATIFSGNGSTGTVVLSGPAPASGVSVPLSVNRGGATVPKFVVVPPGASSVTFPISTTAPPPQLTLGGSSTGSAIAILVSAGTGSTPAVVSIADGTSNTIQLASTAPPSAMLTVVPPPLLQSVAVAPTFVFGGDPISLSIGLLVSSTTVPSTSSATVLSADSGIPAGTIAFTVDQPGVVQLPATAVVSSNSGVIVVNGATTAPPADVTVTIRATFGSVTRSTTLLVKVPSPALESFSLRPTIVKGGNNLIGSIKLSSSVTGAKIITLSTDRPDLIQLPPTMTVAPTTVPVAFTLKTQPVTAQAAATITATLGMQRIAVVVTMNP